ncbi:MAG: hypothetical protein IT186_24630 [Acidobacteria bacterium]|nr:hypothetical protein [Acidobacteriota bacterium]
MAGQKVMVTIQAPRATGRRPAGSFEEFSGCLPDFPNIGPEGGYEESKPF